MCLSHLLICRLQETKPLSLSLSLSLKTLQQHTQTLVKRSMLSFSTYYYYYHTSLLQSLDKTLIFWGIVRCMSWSVKNLSLVSRWRASWHSFFFFFGFPFIDVDQQSSLPILTLPIYLCSPWAETSSEHTWIAWFPSKLCTAQNDKPFKNYEAMHKTTNRVCALLLFTRLYCYIHILYNVLLPCLPPSLSSPASSIWIPPIKTRNNNSTC